MFPSPAYIHIGITLQNWSKGGNICALKCLLAQKAAICSTLVLIMSQWPKWSLSNKKPATFWKFSQPLKLGTM